MNNKLVELIERELENDPSWKYVPSNNREEIIEMEIDKIARWLVDTTKSFRRV